MTTQELREMDAWIAEHVMGLTVTVKESKTLPGIMTVGQTRGGIDLGLPNYTTDPAAAMEVLQKCAEKIRDTELAVEVYAPTRSEPSWFVLDSEGSISGIAPTLPLAICLFARELFKEDGK